MLDKLDAALRFQQEALNLRAQRQEVSQGECHALVSPAAAVSAGAAGLASEGATFERAFSKRTLNESLPDALSLTSRPST
mgnify:CR=1 FL=1